MVNLDEAIIARLKTGGETFEILVDPERSFEFKEGVEGVDIEDVLAVPTVFKDAGAADKASEVRMAEVFKTDDINEIAALIIKKGEIQITTEHRKKILEDKRRKIITTIARNAINPQTKLPHPAARIESAMEEAKVKIDPFKSADAQIEAVLKALRPLIPIKFENVQIAVKIPAQYTGGAYRVVHEFGEVKKEEWAADGSLVCLIEMPGGLQDDFYNKVNGLTHGAAQVKLLQK
ncbi:MAG: rRNA metabolism protein [Candidatus Altiarchaeales archaeon IMC4]|nr:MAG: rRNA metabolism protein [Candidatus Altiarchaeales archaeon IMC4]